MTCQLTYKTLYYKILLLIFFKRKIQIIINKLILIMQRYQHLVLIFQFFKIFELTATGPFTLTIVYKININPFCQKENT